MSVDIRSINDHLLADEKARERIEVLENQADESSEFLNQIILGLSDPLEAEGNPLVIKPVGGLPFDSVVTKFSPRQEGSGDPYPGGTGKNLCPDILNGDSLVYAGVTASVENGKFKLTGTPTASGGRTRLRTIPFTLPSGNYYVSSDADTDSDQSVQIIVHQSADETIIASRNNIAFTLSEATEVFIGFNIIAGTTYSTTFYVQIESTSAATEFAPYSNIRPIVPYTELEMTRAGKNLLDINKVTPIYKEKITIKGDDIIIAAGSELYGVDWTNNATGFFEVGRTYTISARNITNHNANGSWGARIKYQDGSLMTSSTIKLPYTFTPMQPVAAIWFYIGYDYTSDADIIISGIQVEEGSTATSYEPYQGDTYTDTLETPMYGGERDWVKGELDDTHCCVEFTGNETWHASTTTPNAFYLVYGENTELFPYGFKTSNYNTVLRHRCSHYMAALYSNYSLNNVCVIYAGSRGDTFQIKDNRFSTVAEWVAYLTEQKLNGTPVQASFESLVPPATTQRTAHDIPALVGVNTLYGDGDSIAVKGRQPKTIDLEERIAALEAAVLLS